MNSRERVIAAFGFNKSDRLPRYEIFIPGFVTKWQKEKNLSCEKWIYDYYDKIDIGTVIADQYGPFFSKAGIIKREGTTYYELDSWGRILLKKDDAFFEKEIEVKIKDKNDEVEFESPLDKDRCKIFRNMPERLNKRFALVSGVLGLYMGCSRMRGEVQFLMDIAEDEEYCRHLAGRLAEFTTAIGLNLADMTDTKETAVWVYDELSSRTGPMFSPESFSRIFLPCYKKMIEKWKENGIKNIILHCDGNSLPLLDLVIEAGFTGIQSLAPTTGMWLPDVKKRYGNKLSLIGGMCNIDTLANGSKRDIEIQVGLIMEAARDGGVIIGTHSIDIDIPVENYDYYYSVVNRYDDCW